MKLINNMAHNKSYLLWFHFLRKTKKSTNPYINYVWNKLYLKIKKKRKEMKDKTLKIKTLLYIFFPYLLNIDKRNIKKNYTLQYPYKVFVLNGIKRKM